MMDLAGSGRYCTHSCRAPWIDNGGLGKQRIYDGHTTGSSRFDGCTPKSGGFGTRNRRGRSGGSIDGGMLER